jgi:hypothetical protein
MKPHKIWKMELLTSVERLALLILIFALGYLLWLRYHEWQEQSKTIDKKTAKPSSGDPNLPRIARLAGVDIINGRRVTCVAKCQFDAEVCGGIWIDEPVVVDKNLVTARVAQDNTAWMREFMKVLNTARQARD